MEVCRIGGRFSRCQASASETCQYCARAFCSDHAYFVEGHEAVCVRKHCRAKRDDVVLFEVFRRTAIQRNRHGACGLEDCERRCHAECSLCHGAFCPDHIHARNYPRPDGDRFLSVCPRCWERRKVWKHLR